MVTILKNRESSSIERARDYAEKTFGPLKGWVDTKIYPYHNSTNFPEVEAQRPWDRYEVFKSMVAQITDGGEINEGTMYWGGGIATAKMNELLIEAANKGAKVTKAAGYINLLAGGRVARLTPYLSNKLTPEQSAFLAEIKQNAQDLIDANARMFWTNTPDFNKVNWLSPIARKMHHVGTNHSKPGYIRLTDDPKDAVAWMKTYNTGEAMGKISGHDVDHWAEILDSAIQFQDPSSTEATKHQFDIMRGIDHLGNKKKHPSTKDEAIVIPDQEHAFLTNIGKPRQSLALEVARMIAKKPGPAIFFTQYAPAGPIAEIIKGRAKEGWPNLVVTHDKNLPISPFESPWEISGKTLPNWFWYRDTKDAPLIQTAYLERTVHGKLFAVIDEVTKEVEAEDSSDNLHPWGHFVGTGEFGNHLWGSAARKVLDLNLQMALEDSSQPKFFAGTRFEDLYRPIRGA